MVRTTTAVLIAGLMMFAAFAIASDNFKDTYSQKIEPQARVAADAEFERRQCEEELPAFIDRLEERPDSEFIQYKVQELTQMCDDRELRMEAEQQAHEDAPPPPSQSRVERAISEALRPVDNK